jgi:hypothetical protein
MYEALQARSLVCAVGPFFVTQIPVRNSKHVLKDGLTDSA